MNNFTALVYFNPIKQQYRSFLLIESFFLGDIL